MEKNHSKILHLAFLTLTLSLVGCSAFKSRTPASDRSSILNTIYNEAMQATNLVNTNTPECHVSFDNLFQKVLNIDNIDKYFEANDLKAIDEDIQSSFNTRLAIKESFKHFNRISDEDRSCLSSAQDFFKALRYVEDYLIEYRTEKDSSTPSEYVSMKGQFPYLLVNPKFAQEFKSYEDLKSGDAILSRGNAFASAAIARLAQNDYQFSHLSFVYRDQETKELFTSEAHIEIGSVVAPIIEHLNQKNSREVVFRYTDEDISHRASKAIFERIKKQQAQGKNIEYDFSMNHKDNSKLFCSEVISSGFKMAEPTFDYIPKFKSKFSKGMIPFLNKIGIPVNTANVDSTEVFAPGDLQFDPNFELVAEWRNPKKSEESRFKDFILTKLFEKIEKDGYQFDPTIKINTEARVFWLLRRFPIVKKFLDKKFSLTMSSSQMELFMTLDKIGDIFYKNLELRSIDFDQPMTPKEIYEAIDDFIQKDKEQYIKYKKGLNVDKPLFHLLFHP